MVDSGSSGSTCPSRRLVGWYNTMVERMVEQMVADRHLAMVGAMTAEKRSNIFPIEKLRIKSGVHVRVQVGPPIWPAKSVIQMDPVAW